MQKLVIGMTRNKGFTLIELLIVLVIIGITVGFALITFGDFGESRRISFAVDQLVNTLRLAQQQAVLEASTLGLRIDNKSYQILKYYNPPEWRPISNKGIFKVHYFPKNTVVTYKSNHKTPPGFPAIIIDASGDMTPFTLNFGTPGEPSAITLRGNHDGSLNLSKPANG
ncbi:MAG: type II secretion system minor pseudopilin GspH [Legionella sp.]|nr:type II secretion system minor pseudopilin GspH [Legionella sp.]